jgi:uncharacterized protein (DUF4415 family)
MGRERKNDDKDRVCLYVDKEVVAYFKQRAEELGANYQPMMNKVLVEYVKQQEENSHE